MLSGKAVCVAIPKMSHVRSMGCSYVNEHKLIVALRGQMELCMSLCSYLDGQKRKNMEIVREGVALKICNSFQLLGIGMFTLLMQVMQQ